MELAFTQFWFVPLFLFCFTYYKQQTLFYLLYLTLKKEAVMERVSESHSIRKNFPWAPWKARETTTHRGRRGFGLTECIGQEVEDPCSNPDPTRHVFVSCSWDTQNVNMQHTTQTATDLQDESSLFSEFGLKINHLEMKRRHKQPEIQRLVDWKEMNHFFKHNVKHCQLLASKMSFFTDESKWRVFRSWKVGLVKLRF